MTPNAAEFKSKIGLDMLYAALVTADGAAAYTAGTPFYLAPAATASQAPSSNQETQYADDQPYDVITSEGPTVVNLDVTGIPLEYLATILGKVYDSTTGRLYDNGGTPPDVALSFRSMKSNGHYRYFQYLKGKFSAPNEDTETKGETPTPKTTTLTYTAIRTIFKFDLGDIDDSVKRVVGDDDATNFSSTNWFAQVQTPEVAAVSALALSTSDPADDVTGVVRNKTITLTFNNALKDESITNVVLSAADGTLKATTNALDTTKKIMTVNPNADLGDTVVYSLAIGVVDIYDQTLQAVVSFTSASA
jgi:phi13 family phage major tail protein